MDMEEQQFRILVDGALEALNRKLGDAGEEFGFEADLTDGVLKIEFEDPPAKFVVSPQAAVRQVWVSALTKSFKLDWKAEQAAFVWSATGQTLDALLADVIGQQLGESVTL
jgi:CyaY protein